VTKSNGEVEERPVEALMILKYGGVLTHAGRKQVHNKSRIKEKYLLLRLRLEFDCTAFMVENK
jgi:hypothetical protein